MTWNIEGLKRNVLNLKHFLDEHLPDMVFLSEPQAFSFDLKRHMDLLGDSYCAELNSDDKHDEELPLFRNKSYGGTMVIWKKTIDKHISIYPVSSSSFLPVVFSPPGSPVSVHIGLYLPTSGLESKFLNEISQLRIVIEEIQEKYPDCLLYLRGDCNVNSKNKDRNSIFTNFCSNLNLKNVPLHHKTYHHFVGDGLFDSNIDVILHSEETPEPETIISVICKFENYLIDSHHDIILSKINLPVVDVMTNDDDLIEAPRIQNTRVKIFWNDKNIPEYQAQVADKLESIRKNWSNTSSRTSFSVLLYLTNKVLTQAATATNRHIKLGDPKPARKLRLPAEIRKAQSDVFHALKQKKKIRDSADPDLIARTKITVTEARRKLKLLSRRFQHDLDIKRDSSLFNIISSNPSSTFQKIKASKRASSCQVPFLTVGSRTYTGDRVSDGLYDSISTLKTQDKKALSSSPSFQGFKYEYQNILKICRDKKVLPEISFERANEILFKLKPHVNDFYSITASHFINAGMEGLRHFHLLISLVIKDVNLASVDELNQVYALLLHKGHRKSKTSDRSYRTISTCPFISKALDLYLHELYIKDWNTLQAPTQYQGSGSSHELASLMVTEIIQHSRAQKLPLFLLFLDARSAFDTVVIELLVRNLYHAGVDGNALTYINDRLTNRKTYCDWDKIITGPIFDEHGVEQGNINSSDYYKIYNNPLLEIMQASKQGVFLGNKLTISGIGQADDVVAASNNIYMLYNLLVLALDYCRKYNVQLCADKTKLLVYADKTFMVPLNPIIMNNEQVPFSEEAEHVGIIRSTKGNLPNIMNRINCSKTATNATLASGLARGHRSNPAACLAVLRIYGTPVLMSGLGSLVLNSKEVNLIHQHHKNTIRCMQKLPDETPQAVIFFMAGTLPATAILHERMLGLFGMVSRLQKDPLNSHARHALIIAKQNSSSWFANIRDLCAQYSLPHPLHLLDFPLSKAKFKHLIKSKVTDFWEQKLRNEAAPLTSLSYFHPGYMSLARPHAIWWTAGANPYEVSKAVIQCRMLSGRYRTLLLTSNWTESGESCCPAPACSQNQTEESLQHILLDCPQYADTRLSLVNKIQAVKNEEVRKLAMFALKQDPAFLMQFLLDASTIPATIALTAKVGEEVLFPLFSLTRTWCYALHRKRLDLLRSQKKR